jgi:prepilin-type N-terminal cleavage/methylation domain-containing protein
MRRPHGRRSAGVTLLELLVALAITGLLATLAAVALGDLRGRAPSPRLASLARARATAIRTGTAVTLPLGPDSLVRFLPDGRAIGPAADPLTGRPTPHEQVARAQRSR